MLATPSGVSAAASLAFSCRCAVPGYQTSRSNYTRGQSRETGSLSRLSGSVETTAKCVSIGPAYCRGRLQNPVRFSSASIQRGEFHFGGPRAGSGNGTGGKYSLKWFSSRKRVRVLQPVLHSSKEGWRVASHFRSAAVEPLSQQTEVQDAYSQAGRVSNQVRGLGSGHEWPPCPRSVERSSSRLAHQQARDAGRVSGSEILSPRPKRSPCVSSHRQHGGGLLYQPPRRSEVASPVQVGTPDPCVGPGQTPLTQSSLHTWASQCGGRPLRYSGDSAMSPLVLSTSSSPTGAGCHGTDVAEASSVRLSPGCSAPRSSGESAPGRSSAAISSPVLAGPSMVLGSDFPPRRLS